jgi:hypothetical protein
MAVQSIEVGPGVLQIGSGPLAVEAQIEACRVVWSESVSASRPVLSGEVLPGKATFTAQLTGTAIQDLSAGGFVAYTYANKGTKVPFTFIPSTAAGREVTGFVYPIPLEIGGNARENGPSSQFTWRCDEDDLPELGDTV